MTRPSPIILAKLADDARFAMEPGEADGRLAFVMSDRDLRLWLRGHGAVHAPHLE